MTVRELRKANRFDLAFWASMLAPSSWRGYR